RVDAAAAPAGGPPPTLNDDMMNKEKTPAASPTVSLEKTPAAGFATPNEKIPTIGSGTPSAAPPEGPRSLWPLSLSDIEAYLSRVVRSMEPKTEARSRQPSEIPAAEQPR